jgi:hypothetical protein
VYSFIGCVGECTPPKALSGVGTINAPDAFGADFHPFESDGFFAIDADPEHLRVDPTQCIAQANLAQTGFVEDALTHFLLSHGLHARKPPKGTIGCDGAGFDLELSDLGGNVDEVAVDLLADLVFLDWSHAHAFGNFWYYSQKEASTYLPKEITVDGTIEVSYIILCANDVNLSIPLKEIIVNERIERAIKGEFAKGLRNISLSIEEDAQVFIRTDKETYTFRASKNDFADLVELAEEHARKNKHIKKGCEGVELVNIVTID